MFGIGTSEFLVIIVVAVLVLGPEHLPRIMRTVTKVMSDIRRVSTDFQRTINLEANQEEWKQKQPTAKSVKKKKKIKPKPAPEQSPEPEAADPVRAESGTKTAEARPPLSDQAPENSASLEKGGGA